VCHFIQNFYKASHIIRYFMGDKLGSMMESVLIESNELCLTDLSLKILEKYHIQLSDVIWFVVLPRLTPQQLSALAQERLSEILAVE
jgi:hypothetical protein